MRLHANAPLGPKGRERMVLRVLEQGWSVTEAAQAAGVSGRTCSLCEQRGLWSPLHVTPTNPLPLLKTWDAFG